MSKGDAPVWYGLSRNVVVLGLVSLLTDMASEMIHPLVPIFLTEHLKATHVQLGIIAGVSESTSSFLRLWSGWLSDRLGRMPVIVAGGLVLIAAVAVAGLAPSQQSALVMLGLFLNGIGWNLAFVSGSALLTDLLRPAERAPASILALARRI
jgi:MFS family permease